MDVDRFSFVIFFLLFVTQGQKAPVAVASAPRPLTEGERLFAQLQELAPDDVELDLYHNQRSGWDMDGLRSDLSVATKKTEARKEEQRRKEEQASRPSVPTAVFSHFCFDTTLPHPFLCSGQYGCFFL